MFELLLYKIVQLMITTNEKPLIINVMASTYEVKRCKEILYEIDAHIPFHYVKGVQNLFKESGLEIPTAYKIQNVRHGKQYDLDIMKALHEISRVRDENDNPFSKKKHKRGMQPGMFAPAK